jgi:gluconolactonase
MNSALAQEISPAVKKLLAPNAKLKLVTSECKFTEGPAADNTGRVFFTDQPTNRILMVDLDGNVSTFTDDAGRSNGMYFDNDWNLITCADEKNEIWSFRSSGSHEVILKDPEGKKLNGPNDLWISKDDVVYFTDPFYKRDWWDHDKPPREVRGLYQVQLDGSELKLLDGNFKQPNGIVGDSKNERLYVADIDDTKIYYYPLKKDGSLGERKLLCEEKSDGMTVDNQGNVYLTNNKGVCIYDKSGKSLGVIPTGKGWTANVCFGGKDNKVLFITASDSVFSIETAVSGIR